MTALLPDKFTFACASRDTTATMELHGELDLADTAGVLAGFDTLLASAPAAVVVDLCDLSFMDLAGMRALIAMRTSCEEHGRRFVLVGAQPAVLRVLVICGLEQTFEFADSVAEAVALSAGD